MRTYHINWRQLLLLAALLLVVISLPALAQDQVNGATMQVSQAYKDFKTIGRLMGAVCGVIGAMRVYNKLANGDPVGIRGLMNWIWAVIFCMYFPYVLDLLFK